MFVSLLILSVFSQSLSKFVIVTPESVHYESCVNTENLFLALGRLDEAKTTISQFSHSLKGKGSLYSSYASTYSRSLSQAMHTINLKLEQLTGANMTRGKRSAFDFVSEAGSYLFGFVSASQYKALKLNLKTELSILHEQNNQALRDISQNRDEINCALNELRKVFETISVFKDKWWKVENMLALTIQASATLQSIESVISVFTQIRSDADKHLPSRFVIPPNQLRQMLLEINDGFQGIFPVFNSDNVNNYYRLSIATTSFFDHKLCQLLKIPLLSDKLKFSISHLDCPAGLVCLSNSVGSTMLYLTDFLSCNSLHFRELPTICRARPCISSDLTILCTMINQTTAVVATSKPFELVIQCKQKTSLQIQGIYVLSIPPECFTFSSVLHIQAITTMSKTFKMPIRALNVPFSFSDGLLLINQSNLDNQIFENPHIRQMILPKIRPKFVHDKFVPVHVNRAISISSFATAAACTILVLFLLFCGRRKYKKLKNRNTAQSSAASASSIEENLQSVPPVNVGDDCEPRKSSTGSCMKLKISDNK